MLKAVYPVLALLALLLAAMAGGWNAAPSGTSASARAGHVSSHDPTSIDDDDDQDDDTPVSSMLAAPHDDDDDDRDDADADRDDEGSALPQLAAAHGRPSLDADDLSMMRRGLRPSGEHRASADRPPRV